jgi:hypothetical protein
MDKGNAAAEAGLEPANEDEGVGQEGEVAEERGKDGFGGLVSGDDDIPVARIPVSFRLASYDLNK